MYIANSRLVMPETGEVIRPGDNLPDYADEALIKKWKDKGFVIGEAEKKEPQEPESYEPENGVPNDNGEDAEPPRLRRTGRKAAEK